MRPTSDRAREGLFASVTAARGTLAGAAVPATGRLVSNVVMMGMGEPLLNAESVQGAVEILTEFISPHRITVSTVGILPGIEEMARWERRPNLAISLHAPDEERRSAVMPVNRTSDLIGRLLAEGVRLIATLALIPLGLVQLQPDLGTNMVLAVIVISLLAALIARRAPDT